MEVEMEEEMVGVEEEEEEVEMVEEEVEEEEVSGCGVKVVHDVSDDQRSRGPEAH